MTLRMADGPVANLPPGLDAYAGYTDQGGIGITWPAVQAIPAAHHLSISVHGLAPAMCGDVESGALISWAGYDCGYAAASNVGALILRYGRPRRLWVAHYTGRPHICTSGQCWPSSPLPWAADGTQWTDHGGAWDESLLADNFFAASFPLPPGVPVMARTQLPAQALPIQSTSTAAWADGRLDVFMVGADGHVYHIWFNEPAGPTHGWNGPEIMDNAG